MIPLVSRIFLIMQQLGFAKAQNGFCTLVCLLCPSRYLLTWVRGGSKGVGEEKTDRDGHSVAKIIIIIIIIIETNTDLSP